jgi:hypothetical protein
MALILVKFSRISRKLSILYQVLERPLAYLFMLLLAMCLIYSLLGFVAMQMWGPFHYSFRKINTAFYTMFTMFTLHSNSVIGDISTLYLFNETWTFFFMLLYIVFLQYVFMNVFTSIFFEEHRILTFYED